ncbi:hypothetical protein FHT86_000881 [Rhizobium sp. BK313]|uniref:DUF6894 family protein n=1 Tax=Rhizobium sp. BK313 TaxID=2587081 RepID=UPI00105ED60C|nr:hypothetical protein [Rhizobium sp. BK313]MBB3452625.1 hypothetical protein [Rhizobium sp. BK313]
MARYFFHIRNTGACEKDDEGFELPGIEAVKNLRMAVRKLVMHMATHGEPIVGLSFEVADEKGDIVLVLPFESDLD